MAPEGSALVEVQGATRSGARSAARATLVALAAAGLARLVPPSSVARAEFAWLPPRGEGSDVAALLAAVLAEPVAADRPLVAAAGRIGLTDAELLVCALLREIELDPLWAHAVAGLQASATRCGALRPTVGLLARWVAALGFDGMPCPEVAAGLLGGRAVASGLLQLGDQDVPASERTVALHPQLLPQLLAGGCLFRQEGARFGAHAVELLSVPPWRLPVSWAQALRRHAQLLTGRDGAVGRLVLRGALAAEAAGVAGHLGAHLGLPIAQVHGVAVGPPDAEPAPLASALEAWLLLTGAVPLIALDGAPGDLLRLPSFAFYRGPLLIAAGAEGDVEPAAHGATLQWQLALPTPEERTALWQAALGAPGRALDHDALARRYRCGVSTLYGAAAAAVARAGQARQALNEAHITAAFCEDLVATTHGLSALAQPIVCRGTEQAFVVDAHVREELDLIVTRCQWREQAGAALGPAIAGRYTPGVKLLFIGASGTGKTLAAQWLAERLGKPLFRVDLSAVNSKYIGETEKNLAQLMSRAEQFDCVLLFDEADSMFGARTDVNNANDRFANTQTNYLLQRIEWFAGIAVLTSNSKGRFDDAFMRRLDHVIDFPLPRGAARAALWRRHLGDGHSLSDGQLARLAAEVDLPGGNIRNIALAALLQATLDGGAPECVPISFEHVVRAAAREYGKLGRRLPDGLHEHPPAAR